MRDCLELVNGERWFAVHTRPHQEAGAQLQLANQHFRVFLPRLRRTRRHARKTDTVLAPFFPRYLFVILDLSRDRWRCINGTYGVSYLLTSDDRPLPVPAGLIEHLLTGADDNGVLDFGSDSSSRLRPGQKVELTSGPFASQTGVIERLDGRERVRLLLDLMNNKIPVVANSHDVVPAT